MVHFGDMVNIEAITLVGVIAPVYLVINSRAYVPKTLEAWRSSAPYAVFSLFIAVSTVVFVGFVLRTSDEVSYALAIFGFLYSAVLIVCGRAAIGQASAKTFAGNAKSRLLILDGADLEAPAGIRVLRGDQLELSDHNPHPLLLDRLAQALKGVDDLFIACDPDRRQVWVSVMKGSAVRTKLLVPELNSLGIIGNDHFAGVATVLISTGTFALRDRIMKRLLDLVLVIPAIIFLAPLLLLVSIAIVIDSPGRVLFVQRRVGQGNRMFAMFKFRSMRTDVCDADGAESTGRADARVTAVGRFIRKYSIDELPQLFNILRGEMSFVGPRPHALGSLAGDTLFWEVDRRYHHRHACQPGLTGLAQIRGFRGSTARREDLINRLDADLEYINGWSVRRDLKILFATLKVIAHDNAF